MTWNLFIDDERNPEDVTWASVVIQEKYRNEKWVIARNQIEVSEAIFDNACMPSFISFDHDLGDNTPTGFDIAKTLVEWDIDDYYNLPDNFQFYTHSKNPIGKANIEGYLNGYLNTKS